MMTSLGGDKARGPRDKALPASTHITQPQKQLQVSAASTHTHTQKWESGGWAVRELG